ncbi:MAG TPA: trypsin-like peptidase domain-containing protein [Chitinophagaceae bacterium]
MEDIQLLEAVERYIRGEMKPDERVHFEQLRKTNPEVDQMVVEHTLFIHQMNEVGELRKFKSTLHEVHTDLAEKGLINSDRLKGKAKVVYMWKKYRRVATIAASIAGITTLTISLLVWSVTPKGSGDEVTKLSRELETQQRITNKLSNDIKTVAKTVNEEIRKNETPVINYTTGGTGFLIDVKGYLVTNAHVVRGARNIAIEKPGGKEFKAEVVYADDARDIAILKISDRKFKSPGSIPYAISKSPAELAAPIFTLGYPDNKVVYGEGYLSSRTGIHGDTISCQVTMTANNGNSGSPILNKNGEVIGVLSGRQTNANTFVFATHARYIYAAIEELKKKDTAYNRIKIPTVSNIKNSGREQQVKKLEDYVYIVKVN